MTNLPDHVARIYRFALRLSGNHHEAEDITQETMLRAWRQRSRLRDSFAERTWLFRIAVNVWKDLVRRGRHSVAQAELLDDNIESVSVAPDRAAASREDARRAVEAMDALPDRQREVLYLHACEGLTHDQIGQVLGISTDNVKATLSLARKRMREQLKDLKVESPLWQ